MGRQRIEGLGAVGMIGDMIPSTLPQNAWSSLFNSACRDGAVRSIAGERKLFNVQIKPLYHTTYRTPAGRWVIVISDGLKVHAYDLLDHTMTDIGGTWSGGFVSFANLNGVLVVNSESDGAFFWNTGAALPEDQILEILPGWDTDCRCRAMVSYR